METITLENGVAMPLEGFGVFQVQEETCEETVLAAIQAGYRLIDTASAYQNEAAVGRALRRCGLPREAVFLTTKAYIQEMGYENTKAAFAASCQRLGVGYLDLYLVHMPFGDYYGAWRAMEELYQEGKVRAIGVCNFLPDRLLDLCCQAKVRPQVNQIERHPPLPAPGGPGPDGGAGGSPPGLGPLCRGPQRDVYRAVLGEIARKHGKTPAQVILRWNVQQGVMVIPKSVHRARMEENLDIWDFSLDGEDLARIAALDRGRPSMLDPRKVSEVKRVYAYLENPVLTSL